MWKLVGVQATHQAIDHYKAPVVYGACSVHGRWLTTQEQFFYLPNIPRLKFYLLNNRVTLPGDIHNVQVSPRGWNSMKGGQCPLIATWVFNMINFLSWTTGEDIWFVPQASSRRKLIYNYIAPEGKHVLKCHFLMLYLV